VSAPESGAGADDRPTGLREALQALIEKWDAYSTGPGEYYDGRLDARRDDAESLTDLLAAHPVEQSAAIRKEDGTLLGWRSAPEVPQPALVVDRQTLALLISDVVQTLYIADRIIGSSLFESKAEVQAAALEAEADSAIGTVRGPFGLPFAAVPVGHLRARAAAIRAGGEA
jgi:hypothetical protein